MIKLWREVDWVIMAIYRAVQSCRFPLLLLYVGTYEQRLCGKAALTQFVTKIL